MSTPNSSYDTDPRQLPTSALAIAIFSVLAEIAAIAEAGTMSIGVDVIISMSLTSFVVWWFVVGVLAAAPVRTVLVTIFLVTSTLFYGWALVDNPTGWDVVHMVLSVVTLVAFVNFYRSSFYKEQQNRHDLSGVYTTTVLTLAVITGLLGPLSATDDTDGFDSTGFKIEINI